MNIICKKADKSMTKEIALLQANEFLTREPMTQCLGFSYEEYVWNGYTKADRNYKVAVKVTKVTMR